MSEEIDNHLPDCIIVDIDGTLALANNRNPYDANASINDILNTPVFKIIELFFYLEGLEIILITGRQESDREITKTFLNKNKVSYDKLLMRKTGDFRQDSIVKKELYEEHIKDKFNVLFILDDRNQVVDMWRKELGLPCFQVYYGDF